MSIIDNLVEQFPVRKSAEQKETFRRWALEQAVAMGYQAKADEKGYSRNVVIGDPEQAEVIFTAHYDTQPIMPIPNFITPTNIWIYLAYQVLLSVGIIAIGAGVGFVVNAITGMWMVGYVCGLLALFVLLVLMLFGPANKHCVNDNTSGVAAVLELMQHLPAEQRGKAAFILFDNEEKGLLGSARYAKEHRAVKKGKLLINMDCVGDGEHILFFANKRTRELPVFPALEQAMNDQTGCHFVMNHLEKCLYPSDQQAFAYGIAVCACNKSERWGYYCDKIHTKHDTICRQENLDFLTSGLTAFVEGL